MRRLDRVALALMILLALLAAAPRGARADDELLRAFTVPEGSTVFFGNFLSSLPSGQDAGYRIRAWDDGSDRRALISEERFTYLLDEVLEGNGAPFRRFDEASGSDVTITVSDDFLKGTLEAVFPDIGLASVSLSLSYGPAKTTGERCHIVGQDVYELVSPSAQLADSYSLTSSGTIDGREIRGSHFCRTYGYDATGFGFIAGPRI